MRHEPIVLLHIYDKINQEWKELKESFTKIKEIDTMHGSQSFLQEY